MKIFDVLKPSHEQTQSLDITLATIFEVVSFHLVFLEDLKLETLFFLPKTVSLVPLPKYAGMFEHRVSRPYH